MSGSSSFPANSFQLPGIFLRKLFDSAQLSIVVLSPRGAILDANYSFQELTQYSREELLALSFKDITRTDAHSKIQESVMALMKEQLTHLTIESLCVRRDQSELMTRVDARLMQDPDGGEEPRVVAIVQDISAEYESRITQQDLQRRFDQWMAEAPIVILRCDLSVVAQMINSLREQGVTDIKPVLESNLDPSTLTNVMKLRSVNRFAARAFEAKDEAEMLKRWPEVFSSDTIKAFGQIIEGIWNGKSHWSGNVPHNTLKGRTMHLRVSISLDISSLDDLLVCGADVTDLVHSEQAKRKLAGQLEQLQKLESLGVLAGGIAHDFNNLLQAISGNAELLKLDYSDSNSDAHEALDQILNASGKASNLCEQMLAYAGRASIDKAWQSVNDIIEAMHSLLDASVSGAQLHVELQPSLSQTHIDSSQIRQLLLNLVTNASEALLRQEGMVTLRTYTHTFAVEELSEMLLADEPQPGVYAVIEVQDNGEGMSQQTLDRIFDPFFTTKFTGRGLGLATVLGIVRGHGGLLSVGSEVGQGTTFRVLLPTAVTHAGDGVQEIPRTSVLVVDDNRFVLDTMSRMIKREGFTPLRAESGQQALEVVQRDLSVGLVVMDLTMPGMSGLEALTKLRAFNASVPVVLVSGYSVDTLEPVEGRHDYQAFLKKPFSRHKLIELLRSFLGSGVQVDDCA